MRRPEAAHARRGRRNREGMRAGQRVSPWAVVAAAALGVVGIVAAAGCSARGPSSTVSRAQPASAAPDPFAPRDLLAPEARAEYVGSERCIRCHPAQAEQLASRHARTLAPVRLATDGPRFRDANDVQDAVYRVTYRTTVEGDRCLLTARSGARRAAVRAEYAFGSGNRGVTYVGTYGSQPVELRVSYYAPERAWALTPGQQTAIRPETPVGRILRPDDETTCYLCHTTALVGRDGRPAPEESILGVGCEACHGPGRAHVLAVERKEKDLRMLRLSEHRSEVSEKLCGQCHRTPDSTAADHPFVQLQLARFQGAALALSRCYRESGGRLTCVSCHDPHRNADRVTRAEYNRVCASCHRPGAPSLVSCPVRPRGDCISCHMPVRTVEIPTRPRFTHHWIKVWEETSAGRAAAEKLKPSP